MKIKKTFPVVGMSCASCAARIDKVIHEQPGVCEANINYATAQAQVVYDTEICSVQALKNAVQDAGYDPRQTNRARRRPNKYKTKNTVY